MHRGWTKRWRKRWDKGYHRDQLMWIMMDYFIDFAAYEPTTRYIPGAGNIPLLRGQWAFTERELSEFFGVDRQRIRTCLKKLKEQPFINPITNPKFTIISVINYDTYQSEQSHTNPKINHQLTTSKPTPNPKQDSIIIKEIKNIKESPSVAFSIPSHDQIEISTDTKIEQDIIKVCEMLYREKLFVKSNAFANMMLKQQKNPRAVLHGLTRCYVKAKAQPFPENEKSPWAYCMKIIQVENGNFNERDYSKDSEKSA